MNKHADSRQKCCLNMSSINTGFAAAFASVSIGAFALLFSLRFSRRAKRLERKFLDQVVPIDYSSGKTFMLISPYEKPRKLLHSYFWTLLTWLAVLLSPTLIAFIVFRMLPDVGTLSFLILIVGLNLLASREGFESYEISRQILDTQASAVGAGDLDLVKKIAESLKKSARHFLIVSSACMLAGLIFFLLLLL